MESFDESGLAIVGSGIKRKRSNVSRKPRLNSHTLLESCNLLPLSTELYSHGDNDKNQNNGDRVVVSDGLGSENKLKKLKLKVGGVTHTIHTKSIADFSYAGGTINRKSSSSLTGYTPQEKPLLQDDINGNHSYSSDKRKGFGVKWKDMSITDSGSKREHSSRGIPVNHEPVRKSNRVPKRRVLDVGLNEDDDKDEEVRYLERLGASKNPGGSEDGKDYRSHKGHVILKVPKSRSVTDGLYDDAVGDYGSPRLGKDNRKKSRSGKEFEDIDYVEEEEEEEEAISDEEPGSTGKKLKKGSPSRYVEEWKESTPTTRTRSTQHGIGSSASSIDLSNYLLTSKSRRKKEKLSELEQQSKKAEAAQRRRMQSEKAAREAEAEAIRKILGQDSGRKKREEKMKKQREDLLQGKSANALTIASNTIRWLNNPTGTIVTFSEDMGLPSIFNGAPCSYPPPREKCAGPNCTNAYKYRDSKSNLPLCSLQCYKAIHKNLQPLVTC